MRARVSNRIQYEAGRLNIVYHVYYKLFGTVIDKLSNTGGISMSC